MVRMLETHMVCKEMHWLGMYKWLDAREMKWVAPHKDDIQWGMGISDMAVKILAGARAGKWEQEPEAKSGR